MLSRVAGSIDRMIADIKQRVSESVMTYELRFFVGFREAWGAINECLKDSYGYFGARAGGRKRIAFGYELERGDGMRFKAQEVLLLKGNELYGG